MRTLFWQQSHETITIEWIIRRFFSKSVCATQVGSTNPSRSAQVLQYRPHERSDITPPRCQPSPRCWLLLSFITWSAPMKRVGHLLMLPLSYQALPLRGMLFECQLNFEGTDRNIKPVVINISLYHEPIRSSRESWCRL
jgi:hypothetical protein